MPTMLCRPPGRSQQAVSRFLASLNGSPLECWRPRTFRVWLMFGVVCNAIYTAARMPWPNQTAAVGVALVLAGVYSVSPIKRASQARCRELCAPHGPLPFNLIRSAAVAGARLRASGRPLSERVQGSSP